MTTRSNKPQRKPMPDPPVLRQPTIEEAPHLYADGVFYPSADIPGMEPEVSPVTQPSIEQAPHLYEDGVIYPETDGMPLPDGESQGREFLNVNTTLRGRYIDDPRTFVSGNTFIYYDQGHIQRRIAPDCYVTFDVDIDDILRYDHYRVWEVGKPPDFALEIASLHTADNDLHPKRELYALMGIGEYWRYDPTEDSRHYGEKLVGERLVDDEYQRLSVAPDAEGRPRGYSPTLGLDLVWEDGELRFYDPIADEWLPTYEEAYADRIAADNRANAAQAERDAARTERDAARAAKAAAQAQTDAARAAEAAAQAQTDAARAAEAEAQAQTDAARAAKAAAQAQTDAARAAEAEAQAQTDAARAAEAEAQAQADAARAAEAAAQAQTDAARAAEAEAQARAAEADAELQQLREQLRRLRESQ